MGLNIIKSEDPNDPLNQLDFGLSMILGFGGGWYVKTLAGPVYKSVGKTIMVRGGQTLGPVTHFKLTTLEKMAVSLSLGESQVEVVKKLVKEYIQGTFISTGKDQLRH